MEDEGPPLGEPGSPQEPAEDGAGPTPARKWIALAILAVLAVLAWKTLDPGKLRLVVLALLGVFGFRIAVASPR